ncbi:hypothetical protein E3N88_29442 [Mikania micrantha]|uniref:Uncharacterized protein n=1 Tax=Mikania micrantha TaxID=192012 RepID=A0A5N6MJQ1_9ASTR|nr:hypothetical protein E3N88_29442 [Mikania micrantha]
MKRSFQASLPSFKPSKSSNNGFQDQQWRFSGEMMKKQGRTAWRGTLRPGVPRESLASEAFVPFPRVPPRFTCWAQAYRLELQTSPIGPISSFRSVFRSFHAYNSSFNIVRTEIIIQWFVHQRS